MLRWLFPYVQSGRTVSVPNFIGLFGKQWRRRIDCKRAQWSLKRVLVYIKSHGRYEKYEFLCKFCRFFYGDNKPD